MRISKKAREQAKRLFKACAPDGKLDEEKVRLAAQELVAKRPRETLGILLHFYKLVRLELARKETRIETVVELPEPVRQELVRLLAERYGEGLRVQFLRDPELLGGLRIRVGSEVIDGSIRGRLEALQASF